MLYIDRPRPVRQWAAGCAAVALAAAAGWALFSSDDADREAVTLAHTARHASAPAASPAVETRLAPATPVARDQPVATAPASRVASSAAPTLPMRAATDTGRAQPVFLGLAGSATARVGQAFRLDITVESENDFAGGLLTLAFDAARLRVSAVRAGSFMSQAGASAALSHAVEADGRLTIDVREEAGGPPVSGGGTLVTVEFMPLARGEASVALASAALHDLNNEGVIASPVRAHAVRITD
jgi:hypothetical protein